MTVSEQRFLDELRAALAGTAPPYAVAFSGGLDSTVLLAAMYRIAGADALRALHVDHALHGESAEWARHCERVCRGLGVRFSQVRITVDPRRGAGTEAAARDARYAALAELLQPGETLLTAHHADDQLETLLLRMLRGAGVRGMRGIAPRSPFASGRILRPLLGVTRERIGEQAGRWALEWLDDPSNRELDFDRNRLRARVVPEIRSRWGESAARSAARTAAAMRDAEEILAAAAADDLSAAGAERDRLPLQGLRGLGEARQRNALRRAIREAGLGVPDAQALQALRRCIAGVRPDAATRIRWPGGEARVFRDRLYLLDPDAFAALEPAGGTTQEQAAGVGLVSIGAPWRGPQGRLVLEPAGDDPGLAESWAREGLEVRFRRGGERFTPPGDAHRRTLKHWFQQRGIVPWMRGRVPLLYRDGRLVAVADLEIDDGALRADAGSPRWRVRWDAHPRIE